MTVWKIPVLHLIARKMLVFLVAVYRLLTTIAHAAVHLRELILSDVSSRTDSRFIRDLCTVYNVTPKERKNKSTVRVRNRRFQVMNCTQYDIESVTLLSIEEYRRNKDIIPISRSWWWIRSPGSYKENAAYVFIDGEVYQEGYKVYSDKASVRPAFRLRPEIAEQLRPNDKVVIGKYTATVLKNMVCLLDTEVCCRRFDDDDNNWDQSEIKQFIESEDFMDIVFNRCGQSA